jgi:M6 family metalloprotease domain protein (fragment)
MKPLTPAPLLLVIASFDPNGNGKNDYDPEHPELLYDKTSPIFGEQWAISKPEDCYERFFGESGYSLMNFYKEMTLGKFWFYPVHIDHPQREGAPEGILEITVPLPHPAALRNLEGYTNETAAAKAIHDIVEACDPYIDFAKYDKNGDGIITPDELAIVILNAGYDRASTKADEEFSKVVCENGPIPSHRFMVHGTSQPTDAHMSGGVKIVRVSNVGEYNSHGPITIGTPAHELAHNVGAQDMYCRYTPPADYVFGWPLPLNFSLMSWGNHLDSGTKPAYIDPYQRIYLGWAQEETADEDGVYTLYSTLSGKYKVLKITTPDPDEYFLCEIRLKEGFEEKLTPGDSKGGVVIWQVDEAINREWFTKAQCVSSNRPDGKRHDLGNAIRLRNMFTEITDEAGSFVKYGPCFKEKNITEDPFFYASDDPKTGFFDSSLYCGAASESYSLNRFPEGVSPDWKLQIEVLDAPGAEMRIRVKRG